MHVYHGQHNPRPDFDGIDDSGWLLERLAVYVLGQLDRSHRSAARDALKAGWAVSTSFAEDLKVGLAEICLREKNTRWGDSCKSAPRLG